MKHQLFKFVTISFLALLMSILTACTPDISAGSYSTGQIGEAAPTGQGVIIAATPIRVANSSGGIGTVAGGLAGAAAGSAIGGGTRANIIGGVGGALLGGVIGNYAEQRLSSQTGMQYSIKLKNGHIFTVTQGMDPVLAVGQRVMVIFSHPARVVAAY